VIVPLCKKAVTVTMKYVVKGVTSQIGLKENIIILLLLTICMKVYTHTCGLITNLM
jgi:hypothetical protein